MLYVIKYKVMYTKIEMPENVSRIIKILNDAGHEAYAVGGCVRDTLLGRVPEDWDITTSAKPEQVKSLFRRTIDTGIQHGTVTIMFGKTGYEVTTYRIDGIYEDGRHPKEVTFTSNLVEDLKRRDFTINAMAYSESSGIVDEFDGLTDLNKGVIRAVGNATERFSEDALRILRALRFAAQLDYEIEESTINAIVELKDNLKLISAERIRVELTKLLMSDHPERLEDLYSYGITDIILKAYSNYSDEQRTRTIDALKATVEFKGDSEEDRYIRYALLLKDAGWECAQSVLKELKFDNETIRCVGTLISHADNIPSLDEPAIRHSIVAVGADLMPAHIKMWRIMLSAGLGELTEEYINKYEEIYLSIMQAGDCLSIKELAVTGRDLINELGMKPGRELGEVLEGLFEEVLNDRNLNKREILLVHAAEYIK